jgi:hypothetical protein
VAQVDVRIRRRFAKVYATVTDRGFPLELGHSSILVCASAAGASPQPRNEPFREFLLRHRFLATTM